MFTTLSFNAALTQNQSSLVQRGRKRHQVARACENCRAFRIKCDSEKPCRNCRRSGRRCGNDDGPEVRTFASAMREIDKLNQKVKELEQQLQIGLSLKDKPLSNTQTSSRGSSFLPVNLDPFVEHGGNKSYWENVQIDTTRTGTTQCYGPASLFYFIARMSVYLDSTFSNPDATTKQLSTVSNTDFESNFMHMSGPINRIYMERTYEESYLKLFWDAYHCLYPIIEHENGFWSYHRSLWDPSQKFRKPSALIDIILALCLQHGTHLAGSEERPDALVDSSDEMIASRWFYRRSQQFLTNQLETPSIMTLQTHILSVIYLSNANSQNAAHSHLAIATRTGIILGLHLEPQESLPESRREYLKRLWWILYALEMKFAMELGRPLGVNISQVTCSLPSDGFPAYGLTRQKAIACKEPSYLSFSVHYVRLIMATRAIYITFYEKCALVLGRNKQKSLYQNPQALETCAEYLISKMQYSQMWIREVPDALKLKRQGFGQPFSTDRVLLDLDPAAPSWQQRQNLFLELHYHNFAMNLCRPFICFPRPAGSNLPLTDQLASACADHAMAITNIIHQMLKETNIWIGHHEIFRWQWNAALSLIGYMVAYPSSPMSYKAHEAVDKASCVFAALGEGFAIAIAAIQAVNELSAKVIAIREASTGDSQILAARPLTESLQISTPSSDSILGSAITLPATDSLMASIMEYSLDCNNDNSFNPSAELPDFLDMPLDYSSAAFSPWPETNMGNDNDIFRMLNVGPYAEEENMLDET